MKISRDSTTHEPYVTLKITSEGKTIYQELQVNYSRIPENASTLPEYVVYWDEKINQRFSGWNQQFI